MNEIPLSIKKEAIGPLAIGILALLGIGGTGGGLLAMIRGKQENIAADSRQLRDHLAALSGDYPNSDKLVVAIIAESNQLAKNCHQMLLASNAPSQENMAQASGFQAMLLQSNMLVDSIDQKFAILAKREAISFSPMVDGLIADVKDGLEDFSTSLSNAGLVMQRQQGSYTPEEDAHEQVEHAPIEDDVVYQQVEQEYGDISTEEKAKVANFLSDVYRPGTSVHNLDDVLYHLAGHISRTLGVSNISADRLASADYEKMRRLFEIWRDPYSAVGYAPKEETAA